MAKIQLVIEIEERLYKNIIDNDKDDEEFEAMDMAFCNAKPLSKGKWIPVTERLPENTEDVLAFDGVDYFVAWYGQKVVDAGWHSSDVHYDSDCPVVAWMPIEPYTEVEDADSN